MSAINHGTEVPADSRREVLMGYQYTLHQHKKKLREERDMLMRSRDDNSTSSGGYWGEYSDASEYSMERCRDPRHNRRTTTQTREESYAKSLSAQQSEEEEDFVQETPEVALVAAQTYLLTTQPEPWDPREHMHQAAIRSLGLIEDKLMGKTSSESSGDERRQKRQEDARNIIAQARVNNSRYARKREIMKTMKKRWAHYALPAGFAKHGYLKVLSYRTTKKSMMGRKNPLYYCQITCKQYRS
jgi:hypothetical protein